MKNKKGFTLVELLVVIGILGVLIAIAVPSAIGISNRIKGKMYESKVKTIEVAAGMWAEDHKDNCISEFNDLTVDKLVKEGYLKADENGQVINPQSGDTMNSMTIENLEIKSDSVCSSQSKSEPDEPEIPTNPKDDEDNCKTNSNYLYCKVLANNTLQTGTPDFTIGEPPASGKNTGSGLYAAEDDEGISYYFRGAITNNYVKFANMDWKILRINGDGTIRLILNDNITYQGQINFRFNDYTYSSSTPAHKYVGFTYDNEYACTKARPCEVTYNKDTNTFSNAKFEGEDSNIKNALERWYKENLSSYDDKIAYGLFCNDVSYGSGTDDDSTSTLRYAAYEKTFSSGKNYGKATLTCPEPNNSSGKPRTYVGLYKTKIGLITGDELNMAGLSYTSSNAPESTNYLNSVNNWWSMTPYDSSRSARVIHVSGNWIQAETTSYLFFAVVPVINLKSDVRVSGSGTTADPYVVID